MNHNFLLNLIVLNAMILVFVQLKKMSNKVKKDDDEIKMLRMKSQ